MHRRDRQRQLQHPPGHSIDQYVTVRMQSSERIVYAPSGLQAVSREADVSRGEVRVRRGERRELRAQRHSGDVGHDRRTLRTPSDCRCSEREIDGECEGNDFPVHLTHPWERLQHEPG